MLHLVIIYCVSLFSICSCNNASTNNTSVGNTKKEQLVVSQPIVEGNSLVKDSIVQLTDSLKCNITIVRKTDDRIDELSPSEIKMFLYSFSKECSKNIEYTEYSNEVLFKVIELYPSQVMDCIKLNSDIEFEYILSELSSPLLDINGKKLITKVQQAEGESAIKSKIIESLKKAME